MVLKRATLEFEDMDLFENDVKMYGTQTQNTWKQAYL